jgi:hypothetical protein
VNAEVIGKARSVGEGRARTDHTDVGVQEAQSATGGPQILVTSPHALLRWLESETEGVRDLDLLVFDGHASGPGEDSSQAVGRLTSECFPRADEKSTPLRSLPHLEQSVAVRSSHTDSDGAS